MFTIYVYVLDTLADWELGYVTAELNSGRFFRKGAQRISLKTVSDSRETVTTMGGLTIVPDCLIDEMVADETSMLILKKQVSFYLQAPRCAQSAGPPQRWRAVGFWISVRIPAMGRDSLTCFPPVIKGSAFTSISRRWRTTI